MRKRSFFYALVASMFVVGLTSCDNNKNDNENTIINVDPEPQEKPKGDEPDISKYNFENNEQSKKVYEVVKKYFSNVSYEEFLSNAQKYDDNVGSVFKYGMLEITLNSDGTLKVNTDNKNTNISEEKKEYTYDEKGNKVTYSLFKLINDEYVKIVEFKYFNNEEKLVYSLILNEDNSFDRKIEYTYDSKGNEVNSIISKYVDGLWEYETKNEFTCDEKGNRLIYNLYIFKNGKWEMSHGWLYVNGKERKAFDVYTNDSGTFKDEYSYDENGNKTTIESKLIDNTWVYVTKVEYTYDENGNEKTIVFSKYKDAKWVYTTKEENTYDSNGNIINELRYSYSNDEWIKTYDAIFIDGIRKEKYSISMNEGIFHIKNEYTYDTNWNLVKVTESEYKNDNWEKMYECIFINGVEKETFRRLETYGSYGNAETINEYTYDEFGNELTFSSSIYINNEWVKITESRYINNEPVPKDIYGLWFNNDGTFSYSNEYTYDDNGNKTSLTNINYRNNKIDYKRVYVYDEEGNEVTVTYYTYENDSWIYDIKWEYTYDEDRNRLTSIESLFKDNEWIKEYETKLINGEMKVLFRIWFNSDGSFNYKGEYKYDANGKLISEITSDFINNEWLKSRERQYENGVLRYSLSIRYNSDGTFDYKYEAIYDANGNYLGSIDYKYLNGEWVYDTKWEYTYDANGNELTQAYYVYENGEWVKQ